MAQMEETAQRLQGLGLPQPLADGLHRCLRCGTNHHTPSPHYRLAKVIKGYELAGESGVRQALSEVIPPPRPRTW
jgi:hypothetical protein